MRIVAHKSVSYEDAIDAVIRAQNGLPIKGDLTVAFNFDPDNPWAVVEPLDIDTPTERQFREDYYVVRKS